MIKNIKKTYLVSGILLISGLILLTIGIYYTKNSKINIKLKDNLEMEVYDKKKVSSFIESINGKIINDYQIDSTKLGKKKVTFQFINDDNKKGTYSYNIEIVDKTAPLVWLAEQYSLPVNSDTDLNSSILCGDNYDSHPTCTIKGDYNLKKVGNYPLIYNAKDSNGNETTKEFTLNVYDKRQRNTTNTKKTYFKDIIKKHKNEKTEIGIDISKWQKEVDFAKIKQQGVEFVIIRIGSTKGINGAYFIDEQFARNIREANKHGLKIGLYFYSYASSPKKAREEARWIIRNIKNYKIDLPIAFDWEDWQNFNEYKISFYDLHKISEAFMEEIVKYGYKTMLYSSKNYLEQIWFDTKHDIWLAHYTDETSYQGDYKFWQLCENGKVDGVMGNVDINVMYK